MPLPTYIPSKSRIAFYVQISIGLTVLIFCIAGLIFDLVEKDERTWLQNLLAFIIGWYSPTPKDSTERTTHVDQNILPLTKSDEHTNERTNERTIPPSGQITTPIFRGQPHPLTSQIIQIDQIGQISQIGQSDDQMQFDQLRTPVNSPTRTDNLPQTTNLPS